MTDGQPRATTGPILTGQQKARIDYARGDFESTRAVDLAQLDAAGLILIIEKLRRRLDDTLRLIDEVIRAGQDPDRFS